MTIQRAILTIVCTAAAFGVAGALIGYLLGVVAPEYYEAVMPASSRLSDSFNAAKVGLGLGVTQGLVLGVISGIAVTTLVAIFGKSREQRAGGSDEPAA